MTGTQLSGFAHYTPHLTPRDAVLAFLADRAADFDVDGLTEYFLSLVNDELRLDGITLHADGTVFGPYPSGDNDELIRGAIRSADLSRWNALERYAR